MTALDPPVIPARSDETPVIIRGTGVLPGAAVLLSTTPLPAQFIDASTLRIVLGRAALTDKLTFPLSVINPQSKPSEPLLMTIGRPVPQVFYNGVTNAASYAPGLVTPGQLVTIFGARLGPEQLTGAAIGADGGVRNELAGTRILFNGVPAPLIYVSSTQAGAVAPAGIAGLGTVSISVESQGQTSPAQNLRVVDTAPAIFTANASGAGLAAAVNEDGTGNGLSNGAANRSVVVFYATGAGEMTPPLGDGEIAGASLSRPKSTVKVFIDGIDSEVLYAGGAPGLVAGVVQVNVRVPEFAVQGELVLRVGDRESQPGVFLGLKD